MGFLAKLANDIALVISQGTHGFDNYRNKQETNKML